MQSAQHSLRHAPKGEVWEQREWGEEGGPYFCTFSDFLHSGSGQAETALRLASRMRDSTWARASSRRWGRQRFQAWKAPIFLLCFRRRAAAVWRRRAVRYLVATWTESQVAQVYGLQLLSSQHKVSRHLHRHRMCTLPAAQKPIKGFGLNALRNYSRWLLLS